VGGIPITPHSEIVAATLIIEVIVEAPELAVLKTDTREARPAGHRRCHHFHDDSNTPFFIAKMVYLIADPEIKALGFGE
jgi:hypothetical protein